MNYYKVNNFVTTTQIKQGNFANYPRSAFMCSIPMSTLSFPPQRDRKTVLSFPIIKDLIGFLNLSRYRFPLYPFLLLKFYLLKDLGHYTCRIATCLGFANCIFMVQFIMFLCCCIPCKLPVGSRNLIRLMLDPFGRTTGDVIFFNQQAPDVSWSFCGVSSCRYSMPRSFYSL